MPRRFSATEGTYVAGRSDDMTRPIPDTTLTAVQVRDGDYDTRALAQIRADLGIPTDLPMAKMQLPGIVYGPRWRHFTVHIVGVPYRIERFTPDFAPGWPYIAMDIMPGPIPAALVIQAW